MIVNDSDHYEYKNNVIRVKFELILPIIVVLPHVYN